MWVLTAIGAAAALMLVVRGWMLGALATSTMCAGLPATTGSLPSGGLTPHAGGYPPVGAWDSHRPYQGWGTPAQIMDPVYASSQFYTHLLAVPGWQTVPLADAASRAA